MVREIIEIAKEMLGMKVPLARKQVIDADGGGSMHSTKATLGIATTY